MAHLKGKKETIETVSDKDMMANLLDKDFKITILKMLKEPLINEEVEAVKKMMCEQN